MQHTPAPWSAHHDHGWLVVESQDESLYLKIEKGTAAKGQMANARLIAAAPSLLAALRDCVLVMERELGGLQVIQPELAQARAAITKATPEAA